MNSSQRKPWTSQSAEAESRSLKPPPHIQSLTLGCSHHPKGLTLAGYQVQTRLLQGSKAQPQPATEDGKYQSPGRQTIDEAPLLVGLEALSKVIDPSPSSCLLTALCPTQCQGESRIPASEYPRQEVSAPKREMIIQLPSAPSKEVSPH